MYRTQIDSNRSTRAASQSSNAHPDDAHLSAYNAAFSDLGLRFRWDRATLELLSEFNGEAARVTAYIARYHSHLQSAYDADFLAQLILQKKDQYYSEHSAAEE